MNRNTRTFVVAALAALVIPATASAQRRVQDTAIRPPQILFMNTTNVAASVSVSCLEIAQGPQQIQVTTGTREVGRFITLSSVSNQYLIDLERACDDFARSYETTLRQVASSALSTVGRSVAWGSGGDLDIAIQLQPTTTTRFTGDRADTEADQTCQSTCGTPVCRDYAMDVAIAESVTLTGPDGQSFTSVFPNDTYSTTFVGCSDERAANEYRSIPDQVRTTGEARVLSEIGLWLQPQLGTWEADFSARRSNVRRSSGARDAADLFDRGDYQRAGEAYLATFDAERDDLNTNRQREVLYNGALAFFAAGDLERAAETAARANEIDSDRGVRELLGEAEQRIRDRRTFAELGVTPPH